MLRKIWRYSHLYFAISSFAFLLLASITGIILSIESIQKQLVVDVHEDIADVRLSDILPKIKNQYDEVFELKRTDDDLIYVSALSLEDDIDGEYIIDTRSGKALQQLPEQSEFYQFNTSLHRSLFLKNTGRWLVGINSLLLLLMVITGSILIIKRQHGVQNMLKKIVRLDFPSYAHTYLGRLMLLPLSIISLSAISLFLIRFEYLPNDQPEAISYEVNSTLSPKELNHFKIFQQYTLADIQSLEFPFSEFEEDYFILRLKDRTLHIHQYTGQILEEIPFESIRQLYQFSYFLHTGKGSVTWSMVLGVAAISILYFIYSGFQMAYPRFRRKAYNTYGAHEAEIIVLYGSESGSTEHIAELFYTSLIKADYKAYYTALNNYQVFPNMKNLVVFTATHGKGEPPHNATYFIDKLKDTPNPQDVTFSIVGFGSTKYRDFCAYAKAIRLEFTKIDNFHEAQPIQLIDNQSNSEVKVWWQKWNQSVGYKTRIPDKLQELHKLHKFNVLSKRYINDEYGTTFMLRVMSNESIDFESGDLIGIFPPNENVERFYSVGKRSKNEFLLAIKLHPKGICSNYLFALEASDSFEGYLKANPKFHLHLSVPSITYISNGTGIAPYLGMIQKYNGEQYFYWGGRTKESWQLYEPYIEDTQFNEFELVFSRENQENRYIQDLIKTRLPIIFYRLQAGGVLMICGSMQMQEDVTEMLDNYAISHNLPATAHWIESGSIKIDTY